MTVPLKLRSGYCVADTLAGSPSLTRAARACGTSARRRNVVVILLKYGEHRLSVNPILPAWAELWTNSFESRSY